MEIKAYGKINLTLDILGKREDGYHEVSMIMQSIALHDDIIVEKSDSGIHLSIEGADLPVDESNLCYKAARLVKDEFNITDGVHIRLIKRIPSEAGLAGGSADAAAVIRGMNEIFALNLSIDELQKLGAKIGSDVPFCITGGTQLATGRGEILEKLSDFPKMSLVLVKPEISISTPWAYKVYDEMQTVSHPNNDVMIDALKTNDMQKMFSVMGNVLEDVAVKKYSEIAEYKKLMLDAGALFSQMTGSGSVVFAIAESEASAEKIADIMRNKTSCKVFLTETISKF